MNVKQLISKYLLDITQTMHKIHRLSLFEPVKVPLMVGYFLLLN
jgi:hypothetical protein